VCRCLFIIFVVVVVRVCVCFVCYGVILVSGHFYIHNDNERSLKFKFSNLFSGTLDISSTHTRYIYISYIHYIL